MKISITMIQGWINIHMYQPEVQQDMRPLYHLKQNYHQTSNISRTLVGNEIVDHSDVAGASPVGAAPTTSTFST